MIIHVSTKLDSDCLKFVVDSTCNVYKRSKSKCTSANVCRVTSERIPPKNSTSTSLSKSSTFSLFPNEFATIFRASEMKVIKDLNYACSQPSRMKYCDSEHKLCLRFNSLPSASQFQQCSAKKNFFWGLYHGMLPKRYRIPPIIIVFVCRPPILTSEQLEC